MTCRRLLTVPAVVLAAAVVLAGRVAPGQPMDWPRWRGPNADGISTESAWTTDWPDTGPPVAWQAQVGEGFSGVAVAAGRLYTMGFLRDENAKPTDSEKAAGHDAVWCLDAATGAVVWKHAYPAAKGYYYGPFMTPTVEGDRVFTLGKAGDLVCLDAATGKVVWRRHLVDDLSGKMPYYGYACAPLVVGDLLVLDVGDPRGPLVALDTTSGRPAWQAGWGSGSYCCPVAYDAGGTTAVAMLLPAAAIGVRADTGKLLWKHPWETGPNSSVTTPVVQGGRVFISASEAKQLAVLLDVTGPAPKALWKNRNMMT